MDDNNPARPRYLHHLFLKVSCSYTILLHIESDGGNSTCQYSHYITETMITCIWFVCISRV